MRRRMMSSAAAASTTAVPNEETAVRLFSSYKEDKEWSRSERSFDACPKAFDSLCACETGN